MIFLISISDLKDITPIDGNVDETLFTQSVLYCQEIYVKDICGTALYNELLSQVDAGTLTALNTTLVNDYIQPALRYYIMAEILKPLSLRITNVGVMQNNTTHSQSVSVTELSELEDHYKNRAEVLATRATNYLCANESSYPLYRNPGSGADVIVPKSEQYNSSMYFGDEENGKWH